MTPLQIVFRPHSANFQDLERMGAMMKNPPSDIEDAAVQAVSGAVQVGAGRNFMREGNIEGSWNPLAPATVKERVRLGYGGEHPILFRTGEYARSFQGGAGYVEESSHSLGIWRISVGSDDYRATTHEFGRDNVPARPVLVFGEDVETDIERALMGVFDEIERRTRGG